MKCFTMKEGEEKTLSFGDGDNDGDDDVKEKEEKILSFGGVGDK